MTKSIFGQLSLNYFLLYQSMALKVYLRHPVLIELLNQLYLD